MIWVIFAALAGLAVLFFILDDEWCGGFWGVGMVCAIIACVVFILAIIMAIIVVDGSVVDERIAMYEEENQKIEEQMANIVQKYQEYEQGIFDEVKGEDAVTLVTMYPELKSDSLVASQMEVYTKNNDKIKELRDEKIMISPYKWWLYFGG